MKIKKQSNSKTQTLKYLTHQNQKLFQKERNNRKLTEKTLPQDQQPKT